jgi:cytidylate kinase
MHVGWRCSFRRYAGSDMEQGSGTTAQPHATSPTTSAGEPAGPVAAHLTMPAFMQAVALDGLSGVGKSTVARAVAAARGWTYLDTGATYRAVTFAVLEARLVEPGVSCIPEDAIDAVVAVAETALASLSLSGDPAQPRLLLAGVDRTRAIRSADVTATVSAVSAEPRVRQLLARWQRETVLRSGGSIAEGRDVGTVVLPDAALKIWLTADAADRAARRAGDQAAPPTSLEEVRQSVDRRDALDMTRATDPARAADDAVVLDTTGLDASAVVARVLDLMEARGLGVPS